MSKSKGKQMKKEERKLEKRDRGNFDLKANVCDSDSAFSHFRIGIFTLTPTGLNVIACCPLRGFHAHRQDTALFCVCIFVKVIKAVFSDRTHC